MIKIKTAKRYEKQNTWLAKRNAILKQKLRRIIFGVFNFFQVLCLKIRMGKE